MPLFAPRTENTLPSAPESRVARSRSNAEAKRTGNAIMSSTPARSTASRMARPSCHEVASGFSQSTCAPAAAASSTCSRCRAFSLVTIDRVRAPGEQLVDGVRVPDAERACQFGSAQVAEFRPRRGAVRIRAAHLDVGHRRQGTEVADGVRVGEGEHPDPERHRDTSTGWPDSIEAIAAFAIRTAATPSSTVTRGGAPPSNAARKSASSSAYGSSAGSTVGRKPSAVAGAARSLRVSSSARDECDRLPSVPVTEYSVVKARCCGPHSPATWLIAPDCVREQDVRRLDRLGLGTRADAHRRHPGHLARHPARDVEVVDHLVHHDPARQRAVAEPADVGGEGAGPREPQHRQVAQEARGRRPRAGARTRGTSAPPGPGRAARLRPQRAPTRSAASASVRASGFSETTSLPAASAARTTSAWACGRRHHVDDVDRGEQLVEAVDDGDRAARGPGGVGERGDEFVGALAERAPVTAPSRSSPGRWATEMPPAPTSPIRTGVGDTGAPSRGPGRRLSGVDADGQSPC